MIIRRQFAIKSLRRNGGVAVAVIYLTFGTVLSFLLTQEVSGLDPSSSAGYATTMLWNILWGFIGVLILPSVSRRSSHYVDQNFHLASHAENTTNIQGNMQSDSLASLQSALHKIEELSDNEPIRSKWIERVFHPIPSRKNRLAKQPTWASYAWHCLRTYLFLSWAQSNLICRAVHCNVGKPDLWIYLPSD